MCNLLSFIPFIAVWFFFKVRKGNQTSQNTDHNLCQIIRFYGFVKVFVANGENSFKEDMV